jgi:long-subunit acyl-CoA synthetase (AMP-forming)
MGLGVRGEVGEIATRFGSNIAGYWNLPEATAKTLGPDGRLRSGDAGYMDKEATSICTTASRT